MRRFMSGPGTAAALFLAGTLLCCAIGCSGSGSGELGAGSTTAVTSAPRSAATLNSQLLTAADLPAGFQASSFTPNVPSGSTNATCTDLLDGLELEGAPAGAQQARAYFAQSMSGPWLLEVLRSYASGAGAAFAQAADALTACRSFSETYPDGSGAAVELTARGAVGLGQASISADERVDYGLYTVQDTIVLAFSGRTLIVIDESATPTALPAGDTVQIARIALTRVNAN